MGFADSGLQGYGPPLSQQREAPYHKQQPVTGNSKVRLDKNRVRRSFFRALIEDHSFRVYEARQV